MQLRLHSYLPLELSFTTCREFGSEADTKIKLQAALSYPGLWLKIWWIISKRGYIIQLSSTGLLRIKDTRAWFSEDNEFKCGPSFSAVLKISLGTWVLNSLYSGATFHSLYRGVATRVMATSIQFPNQTRSQSFSFKHQWYCFLQILLFTFAFYCFFLLFLVACHSFLTT